MLDLVLHFYWDGNADSTVAYLNCAANRDNTNPNYNVSSDSSIDEPSPSLSDSPGSSGLANSLALDEVLEIPDTDELGSREDSSAPEVSPKSPHLTLQHFRHADQPESDLASSRLERYKQCSLRTRPTIS